MPLLDHFHPPLAPQRQWASFHTLWIGTLVRRLNGGLLPPRYFAEANVRLGGRVEADVASVERGGPGNQHPTGNGSNVAVLTVVWTTPAPTCVFPALFPDEFEVQVLDRSNREVAAVIVLVSPRNKDRPEARAFAAKCAAYLQYGIGVTVVDVMTDRLANLHNELMERMELPEMTRIPGPPSLYTVAYRPARRGDRDEVDCWQATLTVGEVLPTLPLALLDGPTLPLDLESTYMEARGFSGL